jgi:ssDNA thymidine ADP-ribosyltransferase, DarT
MRREELDELRYITPIVNVASILSRGILSHQLAAKVPHKSVAMQEVQDRRMNKIVPGTGKRLHDYANIYICARNPMLFKRKDTHTELCVLKISTTVLDLDGVIVTDRNAAATIASFRPVATGLAFLDREQVFADDWRHPGDELEYLKHRSIKCAEVLVPNRIPPTYIIGAYVSCMQSRVKLARIVPNLQIAIDPHLFFLEVRQ